MSNVSASGIPEADPFRPLFPQILAGVSRAFDRIRDMGRAAGWDGVFPGQLHGLAQNIVTCEVQRELVGTAGVSWSEDEQTRELHYAGRIVTFHKVDGDILPCRGKSLRAAVAWWQGKLPYDADEASGEATHAPVVIVGLQWVVAMAEAPNVYLMKIVGGQQEWVVPITDDGAAGAGVHELRPQPDAAQGGVELRKRARSKKKPEAVDGEEKIG